MKIENKVINGDLGGRENLRARIQKQAPVITNIMKNVEMIVKTST